MKNIENKRRRKVVMLTITEHCNLNCVYCFELEKSKKVMDIKIAKEIVKYEFQNSDNFDEIELNLFGGEPTLRKKFIIDLVEWTASQNFDKPFIFFVETNGTLLNDKFKNWLIDNKGIIWMGLSLDGTPETHNRNRYNSYDAIDINFFVKNYPNQPVKMTIYKTTINNLFNDIKHLHELGFSDINATFANGIKWDAEEYKDILIGELNQLIEFYLKNPQLNVCSIFDINLTRILDVEKIGERWCGAGSTLVSYSYDGKCYPCQTFQPNSTGTSVKPLELKDINFDGISDFSDPNCSNCVIEPICPNCYGINYVQRGDFKKRDMGLCEISKIRALAASTLKAKQIENNLLRSSPNIIYSTIEAIEKIQTSIK